MSKICEKCGNVIPDGTDVCPNCGREDYNDAALRDVLSELGIALDDNTVPMEHTGDIVFPELRPEEAETAGQDEFIEDVTEADESVPQESEEPESQPEQPEPQEPEKQESSDITMIFDAAKVEHTAREQQASERKRQNQVHKMPHSQLKRVAAQNQRPEAENSDRPKKKKKQMKKHSAAIIGVLIGLLVALLLIAGGVMFMLYQMGFFDTMSDEELLGTNTAPSVQEEFAAPSPSEQAEEPAEEENASAEESAVEPSEEPTPEPTPEPVVVNKFKITGTSTIYLYSRGETTDIVYVIEPAAAESKIEWTSSDETVATVDSNGVIRARRGGTCTITGTCGDTFIAATVVCDFDVPFTVLDMNMEDITMSYEGQTVELAIDYELTEEQVKATVWESSDETVATVDDQGVVTAVADGTCVITASIADYTASCIVRCVNVTGNKGYNSDDSEYVINYEDVTLTRKGEYFELTLKSVLGKDVPNFTWKSDDTSVATVDSKGVVTAVSNGTAYITTNIGNDQFRCIVRVNISD